MWRAPDEIVERVTFVVPGQTSLDDQFGPGPSRLTGDHEVTPMGQDGITWSCSVGSGTRSGETTP